MATSTVSAPEFSIPQIFVGTSTISDLSRVDWDQMVNVSGTAVALTSDAGLASLDIPSDIKNLVRMYRSDITALDGNLSLSAPEKATKKLHKKQALQHLIAQNLIDNGTLPKDYFKMESRGAFMSADNVIDTTKTPLYKLDATRAVSAGSVSNGVLINGKTPSVKTAATGGLVKSVEDAQAWRKYYAERLEYLQSQKNLPQRLIDEAQHAQSTFENYLLQENYIEQPNGTISTPGITFRGVLKWLFGWLLPERAYAFLFGTEDFESCGSLPCSFTSNTSWGSVSSTIDGTSQIDGADSLKAVVNGEGSGSLEKTGLSSSDIRVQFKIKVPDPVAFGASGFFTILTLEDASGTDRLWLNVEDSTTTARLTVTGDVLSYTDTGVDLVPGSVNTIELRAKTGTSDGNVQIWVNNNTEGSPNYDGGGDLNVGTTNFDRVMAGLTYAPESGVSTTYFDDIAVSNAFIGASANGAPSGPSTSTINGLAYILDHQNADGSWGNATTSFVTTAAVLDTLYLLHSTGTSYANGIDWIDSYIADNNDYLAEQARVIARSGGSTSTIETLTYALDESTGGFVFDRGYEPDPATTAKALRALTTAGYTDPGENPYLTDSMALYYLTQNQRHDGMWSSFQGGASSIPTTADVIEALLPYENWVLTGLGTGDIAIADNLSSAISAFRNTQSASGTWGNDLLDTASAFYALKSAGTPPLYQNAAISYLEGAQAENGSFDNGNLY